MTPNLKVVSWLLLICFPDRQKATPARFLIETKDDGVRAGSDYMNCHMGNPSGGKIIGGGNSGNKLLDERQCEIDWGDDYTDVKQTLAQYGLGDGGPKIKGDGNKRNKVVDTSTIKIDFENGPFFKDYSRDYEDVKKTLSKYGLGGGGPEINGDGNKNNTVVDTSTIKIDFDNDPIFNDYNGIYGEDNNSNRINGGSIHGNRNNGNIIAG